MRVNICFVLGIAYIMILTGMALESVVNVREAITITRDIAPFVAIFTGAPFILGLFSKVD
jgi:hypothetical protein